MIHAVMLRSLPVSDPALLYRIGDGDDCEYLQEFPGFDTMIMYICDVCGEPVEVEEPVQ